MAQPVPRAHERDAVHTHGHPGQVHPNRWSDRQRWPEDVLAAFPVPLERPGHEEQGGVLPL